MAVEDPRSDYSDALEDWTRLRDVYAGQRAMHRNADAYLRRPEGMTDDEEWRDYTAMVPFFEASSRTLEGLTGMAFYRPPATDLPAAMDDLTADITMDGVGLEAFAEKMLGENVGLGRVGLMVDFPPADPAIKSQADAEKANRRPFMRPYRAEAVFNWTTGKVGNSTQLIEVRLRESEAKTVGEFEVEIEERIRVLQLVGSDKDGWTYQQRVFVEHKADGEATWIEDTSRLSIPKMRGRPIPYIPFWIVNPHDQTTNIAKPPLLGLANANIAHFNTTAQLERVLSFVGAPQPYITGLTEETAELTIGSADAWVIKNENAKVGYLSCPPDGTTPLEGRLDSLEQQMALMGARTLSADKKGVETAEAAGIHRQGEVSVLASCCNSVSAALTDALRVMADWMGVTFAKDNGFSIDTAFFENAMSGADAVNIMKLWQGSAIAYSDMITALKKGQMIDKARSPEDIQAEIQSGSSAPVLPGLTGTDPAADPAPKRKTLSLPSGGK